MTEPKNNEQEAMEMEVKEQAKPQQQAHGSGLLDPKAAALYVGLSTKTLAMMRCKGDGPAFLKPGGRVLYRTDALERWLSAGEATSTAQARVNRGKRGQPPQAAPKRSKRNPPDRGQDRDQLVLFEGGQAQ